MPMKSSHAFLFALGLNLLGALPVSAVNVENGLIKENAYDTDHFSIEFSDLMLDQTDSDDNGLPDMVDTIADAAEHSRDVVLDDLNYPDPMAGYDRKIIIILDDQNEYLSEGAMGVTSLLSNGDPYIAVDPWMDDPYLQITIGHEYFHCVQFGYDSGFAYVDQGANWAEETAVWMEDLEYDNNNDYVNYLPEYFDYVDYSVFASVIPSGTLYQYGATIWPRFLSEYFSNGIIKTIWESYFDSSKDYEDDRRLYEAVKSAVEAQGTDLRETYRDYALWNLDLSEYSEGSSYPEVYVLDGDTDSNYQQINKDFAPALFGTNYIYFDNTKGDSTFYFNVDKPTGVSFAVSLVPYSGGSVDLSKKQSVIVDDGEAMTTVLQLGNLKNAEGVYAVVSALDKTFSGDHSSDFDEGYLYNFLAEFGSSGKDFSSVVSAQNGDTSAETTDQKEGEAATSSDAGVKLPDHVSLTVKSYDEDSVTFSWNRLTDTEIASYEIKYGTKSGSYSKKLEIAHPYTTAAMVSGLEEGTKYYFELKALDADGKQQGDESAEVSVTPQEWIFSDVSYLSADYNAIASLTDMGIFSGYSDGSFRPESTINRAELLKILVEGGGVSPSASAYHNCFSDVGTEWFAADVCYAKAQGWVSGYSDGTFKPGNAVNKVEALKILFQVYEAGLNDGSASNALSYSDLSQTAWYASYVQKASELGVLEETPGGTFSPSSSRTRGEMAEELYRYLVVEGLVKE